LDYIQYDFKTKTDHISSRWSANNPQRFRWQGKPFTNTPVYNILLLPMSPPGIFAAPALKDTGGSIEDDHRISP